MTTLARVLVALVAHHGGRRRRIRRRGCRGVADRDSAAVHAGAGHAAADARDSRRHVARSASPARRAWCCISPPARRVCRCSRRSARRASRASSDRRAAICSRIRAAAFVAGALARRATSLRGRWLAGVAGIAVIFVGGLAQLVAALRAASARAVQLGVTPFAALDLVKALDRRGDHRLRESLDATLERAATFRRAKSERFARPGESPVLVLVVDRVADRRPP